MMTRRLIFALAAVSGAFILWLVPSFVVMAPDHNYTEQIVREAELVAASIARGGLAAKPPNRVGGNPKDPRTIAARNRSAFHQRRVEGIVRHMQSIIHKRILLYDHRRNLIIDSYNFTRAQHIETQDIPPPDSRSGVSRSDGNLSGSTPFQNDLDSYPAYLRPPSGGSSFVLAALRGQTRVREIVQEQNGSQNGSSGFRPKQKILQASAPVRRLKLVQGAVVLIDSGGGERRAWRWRALLDSAPVFAAFAVALLLLLLWIKSAMIRPLARLAYETQGADQFRARHSKRSDEIDMIARRHQAGQIAALDFAEVSRALSQDAQQDVQVKDSKMASQIHVALINKKMETADVSLIVQRCIHRHNMRAQKLVRDKMRVGAGAPPGGGGGGGGKPDNTLPFGDPVILEKVDTGQIRNAFHLPAFTDALNLMIDYIIQGSAASTALGWPGCVRVALIRQRRACRILIEDDGADLAAYDLKAWTARAYDLQAPPTYALRALETCITMHHGRFVVRSLRPARIAIILPLPNQKPNQKAGQKPNQKTS